MELHHALDLLLYKMILLNIVTLAGTALLVLLVMKVS